MKKRFALAAATLTAAVAIPLATASSAQAFGFTFRGDYPSLAACQAAGKAGALQWGPLFTCRDDGWAAGYHWYGLLTHI